MAAIKEYSVLFFDADDTLLDFRKSEAEALKKMFARYGFPFDEEVNRLYQQINGKLWRDFEQGLVGKEQITDTRFQQLFDVLELQADGKTFNREYLDALGEESWLIDGADELCRDLSRRYPLYCVTNGIAGTQYRRLEASGLSGFFQDIFVSEELGWQKPRKEFFQEAFRRMGGRVDVAKSMIVGDSLTSDIQGGVNIGMDTCWYNPFGKERKGSAVPTYQVRNFVQLRKLLGQL